MVQIAARTDQSKKQRKKLARKEARLMLKIEQARRDVERAEQKVALAQSKLQKRKEQLQQLEERLHALRTSPSIPIQTAPASEMVPVEEQFPEPEVPTTITPEVSEPVSEPVATTPEVLSQVEEPAGEAQKTVVQTEETSGASEQHATQPEEQRIETMPEPPQAEIVGQEIVGQKTTPEELDSQQQPPPAVPLEQSSELPPVEGRADIED
jgi:DNA repair exonuclease SbcCD ATPase subunit